jgi:hypothetical protein
MPFLRNPLCASALGEIQVTKHLLLPAGLRGFFKALLDIQHNPLLIEAQSKAVEQWGGGILRFGIILYCFNILIYLGLLLSVT